MFIFHAHPLPSPKNIVKFDLTLKNNSAAYAYVNDSRPTSNCVFE
jgi:hypothetical protein